MVSGKADGASGSVGGEGFWGGGWVGPLGRTGDRGGIEEGVDD